MILLASQHSHGTRAPLLSVAGLILLLHAGSVAATAGSLTFGGVPFSPGSPVKANVPLSAQEKSLAAQGGNAGPQNARSDTAAWRGAMTLAAVAALHHSFPGSVKWPVACAGFSGGGKGVGYVAPLLAKNGCHVAGIY